MRGHPGVVPAPDPPLGIVLVEPEIPGNTGSIGRLAMGTGCPLHLVGRLGFVVDDRHLRRAGLDYWPQAEVYYHDSFATLLADLGAPRFQLLSRTASAPTPRFRFTRGDLIVFGASRSVSDPSSWPRTRRTAFTSRCGTRRAAQRGQRGFDRPVRGVYVQLACF